MVTLSKPIIYISIEEIINTHSVNPREMSKFSVQIINDLLQFKGPVVGY